MNRILSLGGAALAVAGCANLLGADFGSYEVRPADAGSAGGTSHGVEGTGAAGGGGAASGGRSTNGGATASSGGSDIGGATGAGGSGASGASAATGGGAPLGGATSSGGSLGAAGSGGSGVTTGDTGPPVALYFMVDRSGSMVTGFPAPASAQSWSDATAGIAAFTADPDARGIDVGLGFFPPYPSNGGACDGSDCGLPVVEIGPLETNASALTGAMNSGTPGPTNLTPTECAIRGMLQHCQVWQASSGEPCAAVLVTDGSPTQCDQTTADLVSIVADGAAKGVLTFTLGLAGASLPFLDQIAQAGGTTASLDVSGGAAAFAAALVAVRQRTR